MSEAPEEIWTCSHLGEYGRYYPEAVEAEGEHGGTAVKYLRADHVDAMLKAEREKALRADNEQLKVLVGSILPYIERAHQDFWDWQDEGPYGQGWRSKENVECYEAIERWIVEARQALIENPAG